jgi:ubiquinone/menaquinone biosynthesis C-methylase UbiE
MTEHAERFTGPVADYEKFRLRYSAAVLDVLKERCGLTTSSVVADVGAGTGMLAELFLENGNRVIAVEPNAEMRAACERLRERYSSLSVIAAAAEATTLADASVDFVFGRARLALVRSEAGGRGVSQNFAAGWMARAGDESAE